ncbi:MAG: SdpI family protein [Cyanobacteria bacterium J06621_8]
MKLSRVFTINLLIVMEMFALSFWAWGQLPTDAQIATRFAFDGSPVGYMGKTEGLLLEPLIALVFTLICPILPKIEPTNLKRSKPAYAIFSLALVIFLSIVQGAIVFGALGKTTDTLKIIVFALGGFLIIFGNYLSKIRRNHFFGVRTPWTLSSDLAWHKTHRWGS